MMNNKEIKKYIQEKIGQGVSKVDVLKDLFQKNESKSKRKFVKREVENSPTALLEDNKIYKFLKGYIITIISFVLLLNFIAFLTGEWVLLGSILIEILLIIYIYRNSLAAYGWFTFLSLVSIPKNLESFYEEVKVDPMILEIKNFVYLEVWLIFTAFIASIIVIAVYFRKDNKELKKYIKENNL